MSPKGLTFACCAAGKSTTSSTSLAVRSVALWVVGKPVGFCLSHLMALFASAVSSFVYLVNLELFGRSASLL